MMEIMRGFMRRGHHVVLVPDNMMVFSPYLEQLQASGIEVVYPPYYSSLVDYLEQRSHDFDLAIISRADVADRHMTTVRSNCAPGPRLFSTPSTCIS